MSVPGLFFPLTFYFLLPSGIKSHPSPVRKGWGATARLPLHSGVPSGLPTRHLHTKPSRNATMQINGHHADTQTPSFPHLTFKTVASLMVKHPLPTSSATNFHYRRFSPLRCSLSALALQVLALRGGFAAVSALMGKDSPDLPGFCRRVWLNPRERYRPGA